MMPTRWYSVIAFLLFGLILALVGWLTNFTPWGLVLGWAVGMSAATTIMVRLDKQLAKNKRMRVPEFVLLLLTFLGGTPGALLAMYGFPERHKTRDATFQPWFWAIVALQGVSVIGVVLWLAY